MFAIPMKEKPSCCYYCICYVDKYNWCNSLKKEVNVDPLNKRRKDCKMIEIVSKKKYDKLKDKIKRSEKC